MQLASLLVYLTVSALSFGTVVSVLKVGQRYRYKHVMEMRNLCVDRKSSGCEFQMVNLEKYLATVPIENRSIRNFNPEILVTSFNCYPRICLLRLC